MTFVISNGDYTIRQKSSDRFLDAYEDAANDFKAATRTAQNNNSQLWVTVLQSDGSYTLQQLDNLRYIDAYESAANDFGVVTRTAQNNDTQRWVFDYQP